MLSLVSLCLNNSGRNEAWFLLVHVHVHMQRILRVQLLPNSNMYLPQNLIWWYFVFPFLTRIIGPCVSLWQMSTCRGPVFLRLLKIHYAFVRIVLTSLLKFILKCFEGQLQNTRNLPISTLIPDFHFLTKNRPSPFLFDTANI